MSTYLNGPRVHHLYSVQKRCNDSPLSGFVIWYQCGFMLLLQSITLPPSLQCDPAGGRPCCSSGGVREGGKGECIPRRSSCSVTEEAEAVPNFDWAERQL